MTYKELFMEDVNRQIQRLERQIELENTFLTPEELKEDEKKQQAFCKKMMKLVRELDEQTSNS